MLGTWQLKTKIQIHRLWLWTETFLQYLGGIRYYKSQGSRLGSVSDNNTILLPKPKCYNYISREGVFHHTAHFYKRDSKTILNTDEAFKAVNFTPERIICLKSNSPISESETGIFLADKPLNLDVDRQTESYFCDYLLKFCNIFNKYKP